MVELETRELKEINGGASKLTIGVIIGLVGTLLAGILDGFIRPLKCN